MQWLQTRANTKTESKDTKRMQTETQQNDNGDGNSGGKKHGQLSLLTMLTPEE
jgi:hypothetical protein